MEDLDKVAISYRYKLYINRMNRKLDNLITYANFAWNHIIKLARRYYRMFHKNVSHNNMRKHMAKLAKRNPHWKKLDSTTMHCIVWKYKKALEMHFSHGRGFPKIKNPYKKGSIKFVNSGYTLERHPRGKRNTAHLFIHKIKRFKPFKFKLTRDFGKANYIAVKRGGNNHELFLIVNTYVPIEYRKRLCNGSIGIDLGIKHFVTTSEGEIIDKPNFIDDLSDTIAEKCKKAKIKNKINKRLSYEISRLIEKLRNKRNDFQWKLANKLCSENEFIALETIGIRDLINKNKQNGLFYKQFYRLSFYSFVEKIKHVSKKYNTSVYQIGRYEPTSQMCHACGHINKAVKNLRLRKWTCPNCGIYNDRDINAAINIRDIAIKEISGKGVSPDSVITI